MRRSAATSSSASRRAISACIHRLGRRRSAARRRRNDRSAPRNASLGEPTFARLFGGAMHSMVGICKMDPAHSERQRAELGERVGPLVQHPTGFVSASWSYATEHHRTFAVVIFDSERHARGMAEFVREQMARGNDAGVELDSLAVAEVLAQAGR